MRLKDLTRFDEKHYIAEFHIGWQREQILERGPCHFKQDLMAMKPLYKQPEKDEDGCTVRLWVKLHHAPLKQLTHSAIRKLVSNLGELNDPTLKGYECWDRYVRIRI
jgi:Domain of unknown function (DUF4283)